MRDCGEDHQVGAGQRLQHVPSGQGERVAHSCRRRAGDRAPGAPAERTRNADPGSAVRRVSVNALNATSDPLSNPGRPAAGPPGHDQAVVQPVSAIPGDQHDVVNEHRRDARPRQRRAHQRLDDQVVGIRQRVPFGIEDVRVEQTQRVADELVRDPREDPLVQHRIAVVIARQDARRRRQRPRMHDGERNEESQRRQQPECSRPGGRS